MPHPQKNYLAERCRAGLLAASQWGFSQAIRYAKNQQKSRFLLTQNVKLALDNMRLREAAWENVRLREALAFRRTDGATAVIPAEVIGRDPDQIYDTIVINAGSDRGIAKDMPVVTAEGLVGHVAMVGVSDSVVQLLMRSRVSALVQSTRAQGIISWVDGHRFRLRFVEASNLVRAGDRVVSSGLGGRYPKGIPIGTVVEVNQVKRDLVFQQVFIESSVDFPNLEEVFVLAVSTN
ncbi:MAG: rod shape-determining protein MreC [Candidatus Latescibacteria bacterium]|nr:rod shape-determining protein MreC [Candidatus Latescibacterota bacterium]